MSLDRPRAVEEELNFEKLREEKDEPFSFVSEYSAENYKEFQREFSAIKTQENPNEQAKKLLSFWGNNFFKVHEPADSKNKLPGISVIQMFEYSMSLLAHLTDLNLKKKLVEAQVQLLADVADNEELYNNLVGIWGYYVSFEKKYSDPNLDPQSKSFQEYNNTRNALQDAMKQLLQEELVRKNPNPERAWYLSVGTTGSLRYENKEKADAIRYFASLYNGDREILQQVPELRRAKKESPKENGVDFEVGVKMSPHVRFYCFENNRLPTPEKIEAGRVKFYITADNRAVIDGNVNQRRISSATKDSIVADRLPHQIMSRYTNSMLGVRAKLERSTSGRPNREARRQAVNGFVADLLDFKSELWHELNEEFAADPDAIAGIKNLLNKYKPGDTYLVTAIDVNVA